ncbi:hypothetical protein GCM10023166_35440 [Paeniglutamicibacter cryotolerans]
MVCGTGIELERERGKTVAPTETDILSRLQQLLAKVLASPAEGPTPEKPVAKSVAERARAKYDILVRWIFSVLAAIGVLIFGSLPFVDLKDVSPIIVVVGLFLAGLGICLVVWAVTKGMEPVDASLGEIKRAFEEIKNAQKDHGHRALAPKRPAWWHASWNSTLELYHILNGDEREAHLGPGVTSVEMLIDRIGELESALLRSDVGWNLDDPMPAWNAESWSGSLVGRQAAWEKLAPDLAAALKRAEEGAAAHATQDASSWTFATSYWQAQYEKLIAANPAETLAPMIAAQDAMDAALKTYLRHRSLILQESAVAQLRGTFRSVRGWLLIGGLLTLIGGITYAFGIANPATIQPPNTSIVVDLKADSGPWKSLSSCQGEKAADIKALAGLLYSERRGSEPANGTFSFIVTDQRCRASQIGMIIEVAPAEGSYDVAVGPAGRRGSTAEAGS